MKKLFLSLFCIIVLCGCSTAATTNGTPVMFPLAQMFGGGVYTKSFRADAVNPTMTDGTNLWVGSYKNITPTGGTNPIVGLTPNDYLITFQDARTPWRIRVPNTTNVQNAVSLTIGAMPSFWWTPNTINLTQVYTNGGSSFWISSSNQVYPSGQIGTGSGWTATTNSIHPN